VTVNHPLNRTLIDAVAHTPGATLAASIYAAAAPADRLAVAQAAADAGLWIHADVIITDGTHRGIEPKLIRDLADRGIGPIDIHIIIENDSPATATAADPLPPLLDELCRIPVARITIPLETTADLPRTTTRIQDTGTACWLAIAPATDPADALAHLPYLDGVLVMLIEPGTATHADARLSDKAQAIAPYTAVGVDGGVNHSNLTTYLRAGARYIVSGRGLLTEHDPEGADRWTPDLTR
jgi:pentose-5-phosphate-3-epimerase